MSTEQPKPKCQHKSFIDGDFITCGSSAEYDETGNAWCEMHWASYTRMVSPFESPDLQRRRDAAAFRHLQSIPGLDIDDVIYLLRIHKMEDTARKYERALQISQGTVPIPEVRP